MLRSLILMMMATSLSTIINVNGEIMTGRLSSDNGFAFASKFCFQYFPNGDVVGQVDATLTVPLSTPYALGDAYPSTSNIQYMMWDDESDTHVGSWPALLENQDTWTCRQKVDSAMHNLDDVSYLNATITPPILGATSLTLTYDVPVAQRIRPRFWFFAFANCDVGLISVDYRIHAVQSQQSSWDREFGSNDAGLNSLYLIFFGIWTILIVVNSIGTYQLKQKLHYLHPMIKLFLFTMLLEYISIFAFLLHYGTFASEGVGMPRLMQAGQILDIVSRCGFILLLLLLAKGWTISNETLTRKWAVTLLVVAYGVLSIMLLVYASIVSNPELSTPSSTVVILTILLSIVWLIFAIWFIYEIFWCSYRNEDNAMKKSMYLKIGLIMMFWMLAPPLLSLAVFAFDPWIRDRIVAMLSVTISTCAYSVCVFLFWPSRAEEYFAIATPDIMDGRGEDEYTKL